MVHLLQLLLSNGLGMSGGQLHAQYMGVPYTMIPPPGFFSVRIAWFGSIRGVLPQIRQGKIIASELTSFETLRNAWPTGRPWRP